MRRSIWAGLIVFMALAYVGWHQRGQVVQAWMRHTGAISPAGTAELGFAGKPGRTISIVGYPAGRQPQMMDSRTMLGAVHALVLVAGDSVTQGRQSVSSSSVGSVATHELNVWSGAHAVRRTFDLQYDGFSRTASLNGHRFSLKHGNLFVVRFDSNGRPTVQQLAHTLRDGDADKVARAFQALLPNDRAVQDLTTFFTKQPCPPRTAPPPARGAST